METLANFRDLGGQRTMDGSRVKYRRLLRSGEPVGLSDGDKKALVEQHDLRVIVDLRSEDELSSKPVDEIDGVQDISVLLHGPSKTEEKVAAPGSREFMTMNSKDEVADFMRGVYPNFVTDPYALRGFKRFIDIVRDNEAGAVLFHCFAGKDRTGVAAAMIYTLLGVSKEDIFAEYMLTNEVRKENDTAFFERLAEQGVPQERLDVLYQAMRVQPEYLAAAFDVAEQKSGSFLQFMRDEMGVTDADIAAMKKNYLE